MATKETFLSVDFCRVFEASGSKWICYRQTKKPDSCIVGISDGVDVWQQNTSQNPTSSTADLTKLRWPTFLNISRCHLICNLVILAAIFGMILNCDEYNPGPFITPAELMQSPCFLPLLSPFRPLYLPLHLEVKKVANTRLPGVLFRS